MITDMELWDMNDSQRLKRGQLAPFNPNPRWPKGYFQGLGELGVKGLHHPFLLSLRTFQGLRSQQEK